MKIDLNADLGESFGAWRMGMDEALMPYITSANVACGFHAGDPLVMAKTVELVKKAGTALGAHPGFPDLSGFGRRNMTCSPQEVKAMVQYQTGALSAFAAAAGIRLEHVKAHGALYNMAAKDECLAAAIAEGVAEVDSRLILLAMSGSCMIKAGQAAGLKTASEVFADRAYQPDGTLVPRSQPGAVIHDKEEVIRRTLKMIREGLAETPNGQPVPVRAESVCLHGDNPAAIELAKSIREALAAEGIETVPLRSLLG